MGWLFETTERSAKTKGVHASFPVFVRLAYVWALVAATLGVWAAFTGNARGIWGASRHSSDCSSPVVTAACRLSLCLYRGVFSRQDLLLNSFKDILNHSIAPNGMKIECFFYFHSSTRIKTLA